MFSILGLATLANIIRSIGSPAPELNRTLRLAISEFNWALPELQQPATIGMQKMGSTSDRLDPFS